MFQTVWKEKERPKSNALHMQLSFYSMKIVDNKLVCLVCVCFLFCWVFFFNKLSCTHKIQMKELFDQKVTGDVFCLVVAA